MAEWMIFHETWKTYDFDKGCNVFLGDCCGIERYFIRNAGQST